MAAEISDTVGNVDLGDLLSQVSAPTLVLHAEHDGIHRFEEGRRLAAGIPGARLVPIRSRNHLALEGELDSEKLIDEIRSFLA